MTRVRPSRSRKNIALVAVIVSAIGWPAKADIGELKVYSPVIEGAGVAEIEYRGARTFEL